MGLPIKTSFKEGQLRLHVVKTNLVTITATGLLNRLKSKVGAQRVESYHIKARTFQRVVGFRKYLDDSDKIRLNTYSLSINQHPWQIHVRTDSI